MKRTMAVILAGGEGERLSILSGVRAKPAVPFGGKYRIIDFTLSNCVNSRRRQRRRPDPVQPPLAERPHRPRPAVGPRPEHRRREAPPAVHRPRPRGGVVPRDGRRGPPELQRDRARRGRHHPRPRRRPHLQDGLPAVHRGPPPQAGRRDDRRPPGAARRGDPDGDPRPRRERPGRRVAGEAEAPEERPRLDGRLRLLEAGAPASGSARTATTSAATSSRRCSTAAPASSATTSRATGRTSGRSSRYWEANLALLEDHAELDLYDRDWLIHTRSEERAPAQVGPTAQVHRSLISHGCVINGTVVNSVLSPGVRVDVGAVVRDSIVMFDSVIRSGAVVDRAILDKEVVVGPGAIVGDGPDFDTPNKQEPGRLNTGITVVGKRAIIPRGVADRAQREDRRRREGDRLRRAGRQERRVGRVGAAARPRPPAWPPRTAAPSSGSLAGRRGGAVDERPNRAAGSVPTTRAAAEAGGGSRELSARRDPPSRRLTGSAPDGRLPAMPAAESGGRVPPGASRALARRAGARAARPGRPRRRHVVGPAAGRPAAVRPAGHPDPRSRRSP